MTPAERVAPPKGPSADGLKLWHAGVVSVYDQLRALVNPATSDGFPPGISPLSLVALGESLGILSRARAMLGRDIDDLTKLDGEKKVG